MAEVKRITEAQLADILKGLRLAVRTEGGGLVNGEVHVPDNVALHVFRSVTAAREDEPDLCPFHSGNGAAAECNCELRKYVFRNPEPAAPADPEVAAIAAIAAVMDALDGETILLGTDVHERVIRWAMARYLGPVSDGG